ncbi:MAG: SPFH domain-containing protein [Dehalococcoidia bacterium]|jgi:regulator of protease activity HflC (stomatin/prohibitin superfamily)
MVTVIIVLAVFLFIIILAAVRIVNEYERGVVFRLGRYVGVRGPGLILLIPFIERMVKVELRVVTMDVPQQECITMDTVTVKVDAVVYFRVMKPESAILNVEQYIRATSLLCQTTLRNVVGQSTLEDLLGHRDKVNEKLQVLIDEGTEPWGIKVSMVEVRDVQLPETMQRAMAAQAEAERERRAKIVHADGEAQAAEKLSEAAKIMSLYPAAMQLRYLQTLVTISTEKTNTIVFPLPMDLIMPMLDRAHGEQKK